VTVIGTPRSRADGAVKVTGRARYTGDVRLEGLVHGAFVTSSIATGRVRRVDVTSAAALAGVVRVFTHENLPRLQPLTHGAAGQDFLPLQSDQVRHEGQPVALVLAESLETAREAAARVRVEYQPGEALVDFRQALDRAIEVEDWAPCETRVGDVARGLAEAEVTIQGAYRTADRHHHPMEPPAVLASWVDDHLTLYDATQWVWGVRGAVAEVLGIPVDQIRVRSDYLGGGFGCKGSTWPHEILAAVAAREVGRPVKIVLPRSQAWTAHGYQPATEQRVVLGATRDGRLTAVRHECVNPTSLADDYVEHGSAGTRSLYACPNIETRERVVRVHRNHPTFMRAPHEGPGMVALEIAMDELAYELGLDPVELRLRNHAEADPTSGKPFSSKALRECYRLGAECFGWARRPAAPRSLRDGHDLVGWGMASAIMQTFRIGASARVSLTRDGMVLIEAGTQEIGTGVRTILPQVAAEALGVPPERVHVALGDTALPETGGTFGSSTTIGVGSAVQDAAVKLRRKLEQLAGEPGLEPREYGEVLALRGLERLSMDGAWAPPRKAEGGQAYSMHAFGAVFAEVRVDPDLPIPRVSRCVGCYSVGQVINPKTARSQITGGMIWGIGQALLERSALDHRLGRYLWKNLAGYRMPVNADIPDLEVLFAEEFDPHASALGARGIGEIGAVGIGGAIANAVFHATGTRVREVPIGVEMLL